MERFGKDGKLIIPLTQRKKGTQELDEQKQPKHIVRRVAALLTMKTK